MIPRLKEQYEKTIVPNIKKKFSMIIRNDFSLIIIAKIK